MSANVDTTTDTNLESGRVAALLSRLSSVDEQEIEERLSGGMIPRVLAEELGVDDEFCKIIRNRVSLQLSAAVKSSVLSRSNAQKLAISFEKGFMNQ